MSGGARPSQQALQQQQQSPIPFDKGRHAGVAEIGSIGSSLTGLMPAVVSSVTQGAAGMRPKDVLQIIRGMLIADLTTKLLPCALTALGSYLAARRKRRQALTEHRMQQDAACNNGSKREKRASIVLHRNYCGGGDGPAAQQSGGGSAAQQQSASAAQNDTYDALIWRLCQVPQTRFLKLAANGVYVICNQDVIEYDEDYCVKQISINYDDANNVQNAVLEVFSYAVDLLETKKFLDDIRDQYRQHLNNQLGQDMYYFDSVPLQLQRTMDGGVNYEMLPKHMIFTMSRMCTNKSLDNVYGDAMDMVRRRVHFFAHNKKWYAERGVPYTLGLLLHGLPGCGKTSLTKALAKDCRRHIFNIKINEGTTVSQLNDLFFSDRVTVIDNGQTRTYNIPMDRRLIVMEDIDCLTSIVLKRQLRAAIQTPPHGLGLGHAQTDSDRDASDVSMVDGFFQDYSCLGHPQASMFEFAKVQPVQSVQSVQSAQSLQPVHRSNFSSTPQPPTQQSAASKTTKQQRDDVHPQQLTLAILLNVLDGILETPGRILIMTTNHPERLDPALTRPGRIDLKVRFDACSLTDIVIMMWRLAGFNVTEAELAEAGVPERRWTPADVTQKIFENNEDRYAAIMSLSELGYPRHQQAQQNSQQSQQSQHSQHSQHSQKSQKSQVVQAEQDPLRDCVLVLDS